MHLDPSGYDSYVFTNDEFKVESTGIKKILKNYYNDQCHLKVIRSDKNFKKTWNSIKDKKIKCMVINSHANPNKLEFASKATARNIKKKNIKRLIILGCNAGHEDYIFNNISYWFRKKIKGSVVASDGTVYSYCSLPATETSLFTSSADSEWKYWRNLAKSKRKKNEGWVQYENAWLMSYFLKKKMTIKDMIEK